jgi:hypothetical protein
MRQETEYLFEEFIGDAEASIEDAFYQVIRCELRDYLAESESLRTVDIEAMEDVIGKLSNVAFDEYLEAFKQ